MDCVCDVNYFYSETESLIIETCSEKATDKTKKPQVGTKFYH